MILFGLRNSRGFSKLINSIRLDAISTLISDQYLRYIAFTERVRTRRIDHFLGISH